MPHAVSLLRAARLVSATKPFLARGGFKRERCEGCRLVPTHCMCALRPSVNTRAAVCLLMADIEEGQNADQGKAREWLARAVRAPGDPVWTADGITSEEWEPVSPVTGRLDAFEWRVPFAAVAAKPEPPPVTARLGAPPPETSLAPIPGPQ